MKRRSAMLQYKGDRHIQRMKRRRLEPARDQQALILAASGISRLGFCYSTLQHVGGADEDIGTGRQEIFFGEAKRKPPEGGL